MSKDKDSIKNEFVELYNTSDGAVSLEKYSLKKKTSSGSESVLVSGSKFFGTIMPHGYFVIAHPNFLLAIKGNLPYSGSSYSFADNNAVLLYDADGKLVDKVGFGSAKDFEQNPAPNPDETKSIGRIKSKDSGDNSKDFVFLVPSPGKENKVYVEPIAEKKNYAKNIQITELLPYPAKGEEEFIELYNGSDEKVDLSGWSLHDASVSGEYIFTSQVIESKKFLAIYGSTFKFALNNSGSEILTLYDPNKEIVSFVGYSSAKENVSYDFNGETWHWSNFKTPGQENIFENIPAGQLKKDDDVFVNVYANFEIGGLGENAKITWDFGDGHKSYLQKTKHKYAKEGKYSASVKFSEGSEDVTKNFEVKVEKFPHPKVKIIAISANPKGADAKKEFLTIKNNSKKRINLNGWSIATGWKKMINHPIREEFFIKKGKSKNITAKFSSFTLNNTKAKLELKYPDGKVAYKVTYKKEEGIVDDEIYQKVKGGWQWKEGATQETKNASLDTNNNKDIAVVVQASANDLQNTSITVKDNPTEKVEIEILKNNSLKINLLNNVSGSKNIRENHEKYFFTPEAQLHEHYAILFFKNISANLNAKINWLLNHFWK